VPAAVGRGVLVGLGICVLAAIPIAASAGTGRPSTAASRGFVIGVDDDHAKWLVRPDGLVAKYEDLGLDAVRLTIPWRRGQSKPTGVRVYLHRAALLIQQGQRVVISVFGRPSDAPVDDVSRRQYCDFLHYIFVRIPFRDVAVWNEANSPQFWPTSAGATEYEKLLATCWSRLHALRRDVNVISTTAAHHDPAGFVRAVGDAYRASGRRRPIIDTFGHNPYPDNAAEPPWVEHADPETVGQGDLDRLLHAIDAAFEDTRQPRPGEGRTTVWYLETGFQTTVPRGKRRFYSGAETDSYAVPPVAPAAADPWLRDQASQLRDALLLARCQPQVGAFFNFELLDEDRMAGWQSGVLYRDGTEKASYGAFKAAVTQVRAGTVDCAAVPGAAGAPLPSVKPRQPGSGAG
jgi:hypothetical protein